MTNNTVENEFNPDELEAPEWLNEEYFCTILRYSEKSTKIKVTNFEISPASAKGDHYASIMFRANVTYEKEDGQHQKRLIIKTMPTVESVKTEHLKESYLFETEVGMYTEVLPRFQQILKDIGDETVLAPECLYHTLSPRQVIVFEDLCAKGFTVIREKLSVDSVKAALLRLSKFHAIGLKINLEEPKYFDKYRYGLFSVKNLTESDIFGGGISKFVEMLDTVPSLRSYKPIFEPYLDTLLSKVVAEFQEYFKNPQKDTTYVLCHGDYHRKNMMFKMDSETGAFTDLRLLDFQVSCMGPQPLDLIYSLYMLLDPELRDKNRDELLYFYFENYIETLKKLRYRGPMPKLTVFRQLMYRYRHFEIFMVTTFLPMVYGIWENNVGMSEAMASEEHRKSFFYIEDYIKEVQTTLPKFLHWGYFEN